MSSETDLFGSEIDVNVDLHGNATATGWVQLSPLLQSHLVAFYLKS